MAIATTTNPSNAATDKTKHPASTTAKPTPVFRIEDQLKWIMTVEQCEMMWLLYYQRDHPPPPPSNPAGSSRPSTASTSISGASQAQSQQGQGATSVSRTESRAPTAGNPKESNQDRPASALPPPSSSSTHPSRGGSAHAAPANTLPTTVILEDPPKPIDPPVITDLYIFEKWVDLFRTQGILSSVFPLEPEDALAMMHVKVLVHGWEMAYRRQWTPLHCGWVVCLLETVFQHLVQDTDGNMCSNDGLRRDSLSSSSFSPSSSALTSAVDTLWKLSKRILLSACHPDAKTQLTQPPSALMEQLMAAQNPNISAIGTSGTGTGGMAGGLKPTTPAPTLSASMTNAAANTAAANKKPVGGKGGQTTAVSQVPSLMTCQFTPAHCQLILNECLLSLMQHHRLYRYAYHHTQEMELPPQEYQEQKKEEQQENAEGQEETREESEPMEQEKADQETKEGMEVDKMENVQQLQQIAEEDQLDPTNDPTATMNTDTNDEPTPA